MNTSKRFEKLAASLGFKIKPVSNMWFDYGTGRLKHFLHRPDILSVQYHNHHVMTIPKKMFGFSKQAYRSKDGFVFRDFFRYEHELKTWNMQLKKTPYYDILKEG